MLRTLRERMAAQPLLRQLLMYGLAGGAQLLLDYAIFVALTAAGMAVVPANLIGRVGGATLGYFLNRHFTFASTVDGSRGEGARMLRFCVVWVALTVAGTAALDLLSTRMDLRAAWIAKPFIDGLLAVAGFILSRIWVYR